MPIMLRQFVAFVLVVFRRATNGGSGHLEPTPPRQPPPRRKPPPLLDDRFGYGLDLGPIVDRTVELAPVIEPRTEEPARDAREPPSEASPEKPEESLAESEPRVETRQARRARERAEAEAEERRLKLKRDRQPKPKPSGKLIPTPPLHPPELPDEPDEPEPELSYEGDLVLGYDDDSGGGPTLPAHFPGFGLDGVEDSLDSEVALPLPDPHEGEIELDDDEKVEIVVETDTPEEMPVGELARYASEGRPAETAKDIDEKYVQIAEDVFETHFINIAETGGQFYFRDAVLEQIDYYFNALDRFRKARPDQYRFVKHVGVNLVPDRYIICEIARRNADDAITLDPWFIKTLPTFGCVAWGTSKLEVAREDYQATVVSKNKRLSSPRLFYFTRMACKGAAPMIQPAPKGWSLYHCGAFFDFRPSAGERHHYGCCEFAIAVSPEGVLQPLMGLTATPYHIHHTHAHKGQERESWFVRSEWSYGPGMVHWARTNKRSVQWMACHVFADACRAFMALNSSMIRVMLRDARGRGAMVNVDVLRTPYFFKDREAVIDQRGIKQKIFHIVRPHERAVRDKVAKVKMHFRGLQAFTWHGYHVEIFVPGKDTVVDLAEFNVPVYDSDSVGAIELAGKGEEMAGMDEMGKTLAEFMRPRSLQTRTEATMIAERRQRRLERQAQTQTQTQPQPEMRA